MIVNPIKKSTRIYSGVGGKILVSDRISKYIALMLSTCIYVLVPVSDKFNLFVNRYKLFLPALRMRSGLINPDRAAKSKIVEMCFDIFSWTGSDLY
jgi:hypothetical protein